MTAKTWARREVKTRVLYVTRCALSSGIEVQNMRESNREGFFSHPTNFNYFRLGVDCFETEAEALADFEKRKEKKIASAKKTLERTMKMSAKIIDKTGLEKNQ